MEFEAWLHGEMNLTYMEYAQYTPREIIRIQHGWNRRQEKEQRRARSGGRGADPVRESKLKREQEALDRINQQAGT